MQENIQLTRREQEVAELLLEGKSNKQIALALGISESTVEFHLSNLYTKLRVESRMEAFKKLSESPGPANPGESTVATRGENADNRAEPVWQRQKAPARRQTGGWQKFSQVMEKYSLPLLLLGLVLAGALALVLSGQGAWRQYKREFEQSDEATAGQTIFRSEASGFRIHKFFGSTAEAPWTKQAGYLLYKNIQTPQVEHLFLKMRYSKNNNPTVPILIYLDAESNPRATFYPPDQGDWNTFGWTEPITLGSVQAGVHTLLFYTLGQRRGVADLDMFILVAGPP